MTEKIGYCSLTSLLRMYRGTAIRDKSAKIVGVLRKMPLNLTEQLTKKPLHSGVQCYAADILAMKYSKPNFVQYVTPGFKKNIVDLPDVLLVPGRIIVTLDAAVNIGFDDIVSFDVKTLSLLDNSKDIAWLTDWERDKSKNWRCKGVPFSREVDISESGCQFGVESIPLLLNIANTPNYGIVIPSNIADSAVLHGTDLDSYLVSKIGMTHEVPYLGIASQITPELESVNTQLLSQTTPVKEEQTSAGIDNCAINRPQGVDANSVRVTLDGGNFGKKQVVKDRTKFKSNKALVAALTEQLSRSTDACSSYIEKLKQSLEKLDAAWVDTLYSTMKNTWTGSVGVTPAVKLFQKVAEGLWFSCKARVGNQTKIALALDKYDIGLLSLVADGVTEGIVTATSKEEFSFLEPMSSARDMFALSVLAEILGISINFEDIVESANAWDIDIVKLVTYAPYGLIYFGNVSLASLDKLAMWAGLAPSEDNTRLRNAVATHECIINFGSESTVVRMLDLRRELRVGYPLSHWDKKRLDEKGTLFTDKALADIRHYVKRDFVQNLDQYQSGGRWEKAASGGSGWLYVDLKLDADKAIDAYIASGMGVVCLLNNEKWVADFVYLSKESYIYSEIERRMTDGVDSSITVTKEDIEASINAFEKQRSEELGFEFTLEAKQRFAATLLDNQIFALTGPAGSGKTTAAEAIVHTAESVLKLKDTEIFFAAPTGRAANRLKEVVKRATYTMHSLFKIGVGSDRNDIASALKSDEGSSWERTVKEQLKEKGMKFLLLDEQSMVDLSLLYSVLRRLPEGVRIAFLGDIEQLPPIGVGKPFSNLLRVLPCAVLTVTKRASEKSLITRNAKDIIYNSDSASIGSLEDGEDFRVLHIDEAKQANAALVISALCKYHLGLIETAGVPVVQNVDMPLIADDIQIVTPVRSIKYSWGSDSLNPLLQNVFNPMVVGRSCLRHRISERVVREFRNGDRVIHTKNAPKTKRFRWSGGGNIFALEQSTGVMNGDIGKIIGVFPSQKLMLDEGKIADHLSVAENISYLGVEYLDTDISTGDVLKFTVLYEMSMMQEGNLLGVMETKAGSLYDIQLAYALTTHKMQGSQAKLIIIPIFRVGGEGFNFISRNMIYTAITRAQSACYVLGNVNGAGSAVAKGRRYEATSARLSLLDNL